MMFQAANTLSYSIIGPSKKIKKNSGIFLCSKNGKKNLKKNPEKIQYHYRISTTTFTSVARLLLVIRVGLKKKVEINNCNEPNKERSDAKNLRKFYNKRSTTFIRGGQIEIVCLFVRKQGQ